MLGSPLDLCPDEVGLIGSAVVRAEVVLMLLLIEPGMPETVVELTLVLATSYRLAG
jgi:hypothetical protein